MHTGRPRKIAPESTEFDYVSARESKEEYTAHG